MATIRLYSTSLLIEDQQRRAEAALAIARLASALGGQAQSQLLEVSRFRKFVRLGVQTFVCQRCCSEALQVLRSGGPAHGITSPYEFQALFLLLEGIRDSQVSGLDPHTRYGSS
jgi:hypothetical protein